MLPPPASRQAELTELYGRFASPVEATGKAAAAEGARCVEKERHFLGSLWGTKSRNALGARRFGNALGDAGKHDEALTWLQRAYEETPADASELPWIRYEIALQYVALKRNSEAIDLLANRFGSTPLPADLRQKYDELIDRAARG
jgi:tetratricopeptide (TPR) repeat protein